LTFVFPESTSFNAAQTAPLGQQVLLPGNSSAELLPSSSNSFSTIAHDTSLAFSIPYSEAPEFLAAMQEIPAPEDATESHGSNDEGTLEQKKWIMKAVKSGNNGGGLRKWTKDSWTSFVDVLKVNILETVN
jgi:hydroxymethylglutaryl-CoA reductase (NADPH)